MQSNIYFIAWALQADDKSLPPLTDRNTIGQLVTKYRDDVLLKCTETQILAAIDWCLNGDKIRYAELEGDDKKQLEEVYDVPADDQSLAKQLLLAAMNYGIPAEVKDYALLEDLENMLLAAAMQHGAEDTIKNEHAKRAG